MFHSHHYNWPNFATPAENHAGTSSRRHHSDSATADQDAPINPYFLPPQQDEFLFSSQDLEENPLNQPEILTHSALPIRHRPQHAHSHPAEVWQHSFYKLFGDGTRPEHERPPAFPIAPPPMPQPNTHHSTQHADSFNWGDLPYAMSATQLYALTTTQAFQPAFFAEPENLPLADLHDEPDAGATNARDLAHHHGADQGSSSTMSQNLVPRHNTTNNFSHKQLTPYNRNPSKRRHTFPELPNPEWDEASFIQSIPRQNFTHNIKQLIRSMLSQSTYGKNLPEILAPEKGFQAVSQNGDVKLLNYNEAPQLSPPFKGVCNDLAYSVGKQVQHVLGPDFEIKVGTGTYAEYFPTGTHYFILAWPKAKNDQILKELKTTQNIPKACMLIDPSFKQLIPPNQSKNRNRYQVQQVNDLDWINPAQVNNFYKPENYPVRIPIGFLRDVVPEAVEDYGAQTMLYLTFIHPLVPGTAPLVLPAVQRDPSTTTLENAENLFIKAPAENAFGQFYSKIVDGLHAMDARGEAMPTDHPNKLEAETSASQYWHLPHDVLPEWAYEMPNRPLTVNPRDLSLWG